ncbi:hypothetical protein HOB87_07590 [Candidatus Woesearchaeota archaeon]|nr:hypothetical protein [Candidatus Woesearchaeota archaeon]MBT4764655.1 hypothetical protein [bacterium]
MLKLSFWLMAFSILFQANFWPLFGLALTIQPSEIFTVLFLVTSFVKKSINLNFDKYDLIALTWVALNVFSLLTIGFENHILIEVSKSVILFLLYIAVRGYILKYSLNETIKPFIFSVVFASLLAISGWFFHLLEISNILVLQHENYPYFGTIGRAKAFTSTPNMLASLVLVASFLLIYLNFSVSDGKNKKLYAYLFIILMLAFILSISKTIVLMVASLFLFFGFYGKIHNKVVLYFLRIIPIFLFVFYVIASHLVIDLNYGKDIKESQESGYVSNGVQLGDIYIAPTAYYMIKKGSAEVFKDNILFGVGPGQYNKHYEALKEKGIYNNKIPNYDPHSTFLGSMAELGIFAGIYLIISIIILFNDLIHKRKKSLNSNNSLFGLILILLLVAISIESLVTDIMNFRQYWYLYALTAYYLSDSTNKKKGNL